MKYKVIIFISTLFIIIVSALWFLFYSPILANNESISKFRYVYQNFCFKIIRGLQSNKQPIIFNPVYSFTVQKWGDSNVYTFTGKYVKSDTINSVIYLKDKLGRVYAFKVSDDFVNIQVDFNSSNLDYKPNQDIINLDNLPLSDKSQVKIMWDDTRTLSTILKDYSKNKTVPLNSKSQKYFSITKRG